MSFFLDAATILIDPMLLAIAVIYTYGFIVRFTPSIQVRQWVMGLTFGLGALFAMATPMVFADGVIIDMRSLLVGLSSAFFGLPGAVVAGIIGLVTRFIIGGDGAVSGMIGITLAVGAGSVWAAYVRQKLKTRTMEHVCLGLMISVHLMSIPALPSDIMWPVMFQIAPILMAFNFVGAILIGSLLTREEELAAENKALVNAATTDPLTRLHNRRSAVAAYENLPTPQAADHGIAMLCFDIDNFKTVNDTYGHVLGDVVLSEISTRIGKTLRPTDVFSRLGGDEFLIILPSVTNEETQRIAERCREVIAQEAVIHDGQAISVTISIGAEWLADRPDFLTFVASADEALYQAKKLGRNCVAFTWQNATFAAQALRQQPQERIA
jgi:diguanylate cyclase